MADAMVEAVDLSKRFDSTEVLRGVSFTLAKGETLVIMGGSGAGKTVLLRLVAGLIRPGGGRLRGFGRALSVEPEMLLFDEPTAGLDPTNSRLVADLILQLRHGVCDTTIVVTHDIELARTVADRVAVLIDGRFGALGPAASVLSGD